jgi:putative colanic acid biosynthesis UDP-glucose lipid carrier transferase
MASNCNVAAERHTALHYLYRLGDSLLIGAAGVTMGALYFPGEIREEAPVHGFLTTLCSLAALVVFPAFGIHESWRGRSQAVLALRIWAAWTTVFITGLPAGHVSDPRVRHRLHPARPSHHPAHRAARLDWRIRRLRQD